MTTVVMAPDSFKGTISAAEAARALADGWRRIDPAAVILSRPMADGGEGTVDAFVTAVPGAQRMPIAVDGPAGTPTDTSWLLLPPTPDSPAGTAVIDIGSTSGIEMLDELRPWDADTSGFGQAIVAALDHGVSRLVLGIGSSASTDGGAGLLSVLGARFLDESGAPVAPGARGLLDVAAVDLTGLRPIPDAVVLTDVTNPLTGDRGAAAVFGPQKGFAADADIRRLDRSLARLAGLIGVDPSLPGAGAAGGAGAALMRCGARIEPGAAEVSRLIGLADSVTGADVVITGEGSYDGQSGDGKVPSYVAGIAAAAGARAAVVAGRIAPEADTGLFAAAVSLTDLAGSAEESLGEPARWLRAAGADLARRL
ncbi:glycerate kinase [Microbacterium sp. YMB-B2]|uniref:Glycerate kinase n=1 Tax=Microbacterium tenebrionis TaxID=2830665 RepID=A0A9X1LM17_9MICO|nr:glycerate kinase [Microbacterium tenebrionis]MCC2028116.1 glycerate kinase [Microbacterium tenebrionis]